MILAGYTRFSIVRVKFNHRECRIDIYLRTLSFNIQIQVGLFSCLLVWMSCPLP